MSFVKIFITVKLHIAVKYLIILINIFNPITLIETEYYF